MGAHSIPLLTQVIVLPPKDRHLPGAGAFRMLEATYRLSPNPLRGADGAD
jgi:hypothetical protein